MLMLALVCFAAGIVVHWVWLGRDGRAAFAEVRRCRRSDRVREALMLAQENHFAGSSGRGLRWARKALGLDRLHGEAHAVAALCLDGLHRFGEGLVHHRRAESLNNGGGWRLDNALDAVQACLHLRGEAAGAEAKQLWDEAAGWARLAYSIDAEETLDALSTSPWIISLVGGEEWLRP